VARGDLHHVREMVELAHVPRHEEEEGGERGHRQPAEERAKRRTASSTTRRGRKPRSASGRPTDVGRGAGDGSVAAKPPKNGATTLPVPCAISSASGSCLRPVIPSATTAESSDSMAPARRWRRRREQLPEEREGQTSGRPFGRGATRGGPGGRQRRDAVAHEARPGTGSGSRSWPRRSPARSGRGARLRRLPPPGPRGSGDQAAEARPGDEDGQVRTPMARSGPWMVGSAPPAPARARRSARACSSRAAEEVPHLEVAMTTAMPAVKPWSPGRARTR